MLILNSKLKLLPFLTVAALSLFFLNDAHAFGKRPVKPAPVDPPPQVDPPSGDVIRARWEATERDGAAWSQHVYDQLPALAPNLLAKAPSDVAQYCPNYSNLTTADKKNFWVYLLSSMSELESGHDTGAKYVENFLDRKGNPVISSGLLQISIESGNAYGCGFANQNQLYDPLKNLDCGLRILNKWVGNDGSVGGKSGTTWLGGARYWAVLRNKTSTIQKWTQAQQICWAN
jgi:hypothetical protein